MQYKIASAALAALAVSSVNAGLISRQNALVIQPGYIVTPTISFNFQNLGAEALAYQTLAQLRDDLSRTAALVVELNKAATTVAADKQAQAQAVVKQVQANADAIRAKLEELTAALIARGNGGGGGGGSGGGAPGVPAIPSVAVPSVALPGVPSVAVPSVGIPSVALPGVPSVAIPSVSIPGVPSVAIPSVSLPGAPGVPSVAVPSVAVPSVSLPGVPGVPSVAVPSVSLPGAPGVPSVAVPSVAVPSVSLPGVPGVPSVAVPSVAIPSVSLPAVPGVPSVAVPSVAVPSVTVPDVPIASATSTAIGTVGGVVAALDAVVAQARALNTQVRTQLSLIGSYLEQLITPLLGQVKTESATAIANSFKQIATASDAFLAAAQTALANGNGASAALLQRIADARVSLNPTLVAGISPNVSV
ncbi:hypothetical protein GCG54_00012138 [Colletotrichum gloeosporioides]|uniref:Uncharacterized protein n=1 Tax=Colletotrichum gloeosporioides TaxID=474922 RepID=A0A8H4FJR7_COLGL|nr:uncharacterized protein GCG54_00012138 [Colletotrichum gloeosporioides]KAF3804650.1 hypothetical protein GCG54_00012138 [Colletotrichum gloeosporioides]